ncbi:MAG: hypothetical protein LBQ23_02645 [Puniceicoccales bacterium]|nr:hypothetical protein [Puniceicoccales bacterium]
MKSLNTIDGMNFVFKAFKNNGEIVNSIIAAVNQQEAVKLIKQQHLRLVYITEEKSRQRASIQLFKRKQRPTALTNTFRLFF